MDHDDVLATTFEEQRDRLVAVAHRMLGSRSDAEDVVQEAWLRLARQQPGTIENLSGWLTTVVGRICIDTLRARTARPEVPFDEPPPFLVAEDDSPEELAVVADSVGLALVVVLEALRPDERLAFVLHDLFAVPFAEIGPILGKSVDATKMLASRARRKVHRAAPTDVHGQREVVDAFLAAARDGDFDRLLELLHPDVVWRTHTPRSVVEKVGAAEVVDAARNGLGRAPVRARRVLVDGRPGLLVWGPSGKPVSVMACTVAHGVIVELVALLDPTRLAGVDLLPPPE